MLLVLEIMLTISAWWKGYKAWALLPVGLAFMIGFLSGLNNHEPAESGDVFSLVWVDLLAIVILGVMIAFARNTEGEEVKKTGESGELIPKQDGQRELAASQTK